MKFLRSRNDRRRAEDWTRAMFWFVLGVLSCAFVGVFVITFFEG